MSSSQPDEARDDPIGAARDLIRQRNSGSIANEPSFTMAISAAVQRWVPSALIRGACVIAYLALAVLAGAPWWVFACAALAGAGVYAALADALYRVYNVRPRDPFARLVIASSEGTRFDRVPNLAGLLEGFGLLALLAGLYGFGGDGVLTLLGQASAAVFLGSIAVNILLDPAFYNPAARTNGAWQWMLDLIRRTGAGICVGLCAAIATWAFSSAEERILSLAISAGLLSVAARTGDIDRVAVSAPVSAGRYELQGRKTVTAAIHSLVGAPLGVMQLFVQLLGPEHLSLKDIVRQTESGYRETLALEGALWITIDWPGVLENRAAQIARLYGCSVLFSCTAESISMADRQVARLLIDDLAVNAGKAVATTIELEIDHTSDGYWIVTVTDDAPPFRDGDWLARGGSLERWHHELAGIGGSLSYRTIPGNRKAITGRWQHRPDDTHTTT